MTYYLAVNCGQILLASASFAIDFLECLSSFQDLTEVLLNVQELKTKCSETSWSYNNGRKMCFPSNLKCFLFLKNNTFCGLLQQPPVN